MTKKVLITGITGMIGSHVAAACRNKGYETYGIARNSAESRLKAVLDPAILRCDVTDRDQLASVISKIKPDIIFHFAAQAFNGISWECEELTHRTNIWGTLNLLNCAKEIAPTAQVLLSCSSAEYGDFREEDCPLKEEQPLKPITPYGVSKRTVEALGYQYFSNYKMAIYLPRLFIHVGTGHPPTTAIQSFARQLALISKGLQEPVVKVGNIKTARDFIDARDGVEAMMLILEKGEPGVPINICNNELVPVEWVLETLIRISGSDVRIVVDPQLYRPSDEKVLMGDNSKIKELGWKRKYSMEETLKAVYEDWLGRI
jgi:GDP-4-dehydro-6-deoxy-D-mannose reductase